MSSICITPALFNLIMGCFPPTFFEAATDTYEETKLSGNKSSLVKKMKLVQKLAYNKGCETVPDKLFTMDATVMAHIIKLLALIAGADPEQVTAMWFEAIERGEDKMNEGAYLRLCERVKHMKTFYDFIIPAAKRDDFIIELENDNDGDWIRMSYFRK